jgi:hypothetical protein
MELPSVFFRPDAEHFDDRDSRAHRWHLREFQRGLRFQSREDKLQLIRRCGQRLVRFVPIIMKIDPTCIP